MALKFLPSFVMGCALNPYSLLKKCEKSDCYWACLSRFIIHAIDYFRIYLRIGVPWVRAFWGWAVRSITSLLFQFTWRRAFKKGCWFIHQSHYKNPRNVMRAVAWFKNKGTYVGVSVLQSQRPLVFRLLTFYSLPYQYLQELHPMSTHRKENSVLAEVLCPCRDGFLFQVAWSLSFHENWCWLHKSSSSKTVQPWGGSHKPWLLTMAPTLLQNPSKNGWSTSAADKSFLHPAIRSLKAWLKVLSRSSSVPYHWCSHHRFHLLIERSTTFCFNTGTLFTPPLKKTLRCFSREDHSDQACNVSCLQRWPSWMATIFSQREASY